MEKFFLVTPLGFESEARNELLEIWPELLTPSAQRHQSPMPLFEITKGGVEFEADIHLALQLNFFVKTANRILLRLATFKVRDFPKLYQKVQNLKLQQRIDLNSLAIKVTASQSRLGHEKRVEQTIAEALKVKLTDEAEQTLYVRIHQDECVISLDSSGEHLHRRGYHKYRGEAPLRETIAAFCLRKLMTNVSLAARQKITLLDPLCGSGTFLTEASGLYQGVFDRPYAFQKWKGLSKFFQLEKISHNYKMPLIFPFERALGFDQDKNMIELAEKNRNLFSKTCRVGLIEYHIEDLFDEKTNHKSLEKLWVITNPPYGDRLPLTSAQKLFEQICTKHQPARLGLLWPEEIFQQIRCPQNYKQISKSLISNGGIKSLFCVYENSDS